MMKRLLLLLPLALGAGDDFISHYEYGEMLYSNPRGISCAQCHGDKGQGKIIVKYREDHEDKTIQGVDIRKESLSRMINSISERHPVMPRYYLTDEEVKAIYDYLQKRNEKYLQNLKK